MMIEKTRGGLAARALLTVTILGLLACGDRDAATSDEALSVDPNAAMDTTPAGTPAPPSPEVLQESNERQVTVRLREWEVELSRTSVPSGEVTFHLMNTGTREHALEVEGQGMEEESERIGPGASTTLTVTLAPGTYELYCPVVDQRDHQAAGMRTTLTVR